LMWKKMYRGTIRVADTKYNTFADTKYNLFSVKMSD
jgi:hypothetical protein